MVLFLLIPRWELKDFLHPPDQTLPVASVLRIK